MLKINKINYKIKSNILRFKKVLNKINMMDIIFIMKIKWNIHKDIKILKNFYFRNKFISKIKIFQNFNIFMNIPFNFHNKYDIHHNIIFIIIKNKLYFIKNFFLYLDLNIKKNFLLYYKKLKKNFFLIFFFFNKISLNFLLLFIKICQKNIKNIIK